MRRRIAQLVTELDPGGAERVVHDLATGLDPARFESVVISLEDAGGEVARWLGEAGVPVRSVGMRRKLDPGARKRLASILRDERAELLHTHLLHASYLGRRAARAGGVGAVVSTVHLVERAWLPWRTLADRLTAPLADAVVCVSESVRSQYLARVGADAGRIRVIHNGIAPARFRGPFDRAEIRRELGLDEADRVVASLGRLRRQKGHDIALRAFAAVAREDERARLLVVGDGPERARLERLRARLSLGERAVFTGQRRDVPEILSAADCLVAASRYEGFGLAVAEGMAAGVPVVASRVDSIPELIEDGVTGLLVPPGDADALARAVARVLGDPELARFLGARARERVSERFTLSRMLRAHEELYDELLDRGAPDAGGEA
jgi:glycosyltransferase involved in cell wall biosynthesis